MKHCVWFAIVIFASSLMTLAPAQVATKKPAKKDLYDETADAGQQVAAALESAARDERRVLIQWGADWCGWCHLLSGTFEKDAEVRRKLQYEYEHIHVDVGRFDKHLDIAEKYGAQFKKEGVPYLTILDARGNVIANAETAQFEAKEEGVQAHDPLLLLEFLTEHQAPYRKAQGVLDAALADAKAKERRVLLTFGAPWCGWCHRLEDWMATQPVAALLAEDFVTVKVDVDRTVGGKELLAQYRKSEGGGIPWFVFLEPNGEIVVTSDGPAGNLGCPWTDEEIAAFGDILGKACRRLDATGIAKLQDLLLAARKAAEAKRAANSGGD